MKEPGRILMADRMLAGTNWAYFEDSFIAPDKTDSFRSKVKEDIADCAIFDVTNVAEYTENGDKDFYTWDMLPSSRTPFEKQWFEYSNSKGFSRVGVLCYFRDHWDSLFARRYASSITGLPTPDFGPGFKFSIEFYPFVDYASARSKLSMKGPPGEGVVPFGTLVMLVDERGCIAPDSAKTVLPYRVSETIEEGDASALGAVVNGLILPCHFAIGFLNCKNVIVEQRQAPAALSKSFQKKNGKPLLRYHTLEIEPMRKVLEGEGGISRNGLGKALHICRGHFATYTEDKPLFGRVTGTFWKSSHVRGDLKHGAVVTDYKVMAPNG